MKIFARLINSFRKFPGVGPKQAERFAINVIRMPESEIAELLEAITELRTSIKLCKKCFNYAKNDFCDICSNSQRDESTVCVVETVQDLEAIEKTGFYKGIYHVLGGVFSPLSGLGESALRIRELVSRTEKEKIKEVIIATNPSAEGEATAMYIKNLTSGKVEKISRIACGVPLGGDINYMDELTLTHALDGRRNI